MRRIRRDSPGFAGVLSPNCPREHRAGAPTTSGQRRGACDCGLLVPVNSLAGRRGSRQPSRSTGPARRGSRSRARPAASRAGSVRDEAPGTAQEIPAARSSASI
jgi:hypothetical protein